MSKTFNISHRSLVYLGLFIAFLLRIFNLNYEGLWNDELFTAFSADPSRSLKWTIDFVGADVHPPLHNILSKYWAENFGYGDTALRMLNVILGTLGVLSVYQIGKLLFNKKVAMAAMWLAVVNSFLIEYSQEVRAYILLFVLANYSFYFFVKILYNTPKKRNVIAYILLTAGALYTHYFGLFVIASQGIALLFLMDYSEFKNRWKTYAIMFVGPLLLFIPWMPYFITHSKQPFVWIQKAEMGMLLSFPQAFFNDLILGTVAALFITIIFIYFTFGRLFRSAVLERLMGKYNKSFLLILIWIVVYFGIPFIRSFISTSNMNDRYFIVIVTPLILLLAYPISLLNKKRKRVMALAIVMLYSLLTIALNTQPYFDNKAMYRDIVKETTSIEATTPILYLTARTRNFDYYLRRNKFRQLRARTSDFDKFMSENDPTEYMVFIDLHHKVHKLEDILSENKLQYPGYELFEVKEKSNINNIKTVRRLHYKKI